MYLKHARLPIPPLVRDGMNDTTRAPERRPWPPPLEGGDPLIYAGLPLRSEGALSPAQSPDGLNHHHQPLATTGV